MQGRARVELAATEPRRVALRVLLTLRLLHERPRAPNDLVECVRERMGAAAYGARPIFALRRDIQCLREAGFAVDFARAAGVYRLDDSGLRTSLGEPLARALALVRGAFGPGVPHATEVQQLVERIAQLLPASERQFLEREPPLRLDLMPANGTASIETTLDRLERAINWGLQVRFRYRSHQSDESKERLVEPRELAYRHGHLYLEAYDVEAQQAREFRVDRIQTGSLAVLPNRRPPGRRSPRRYRLRYRLSPMLARLGVSERFADQQIEMQADGSAIVSAEVESLFWAEVTLLKYGDQVEVLEPAELLERLRTTVQGMAALYAGSDGKW